jgi:RNA polymerase sigma-70 factor (ECF subfamily)
MNLGPAADPSVPPSPPVLDPVWLEPYPDALLADTEPDPEARYTLKQSVALAFLATLQALPARQRAVLLLRDVLGWRADEVAEFLNMSVAGANSALQRARATLESRELSAEKGASMETERKELSPLLARYVRAWEQADLSGLAALLREDAVLAMPPMPSWYQGRESIVAMLAASVLAGDARGRFRFVPTSANGMPAFGCYQIDPASGVYRPLALQVLEPLGDAIREITSFLDGRLFAKFGLPETLAR